MVSGSPSSQGAVLNAVSQPLPASQLSSVHTSPSSQSGAAPPTHDPPEQVSFVVQALPSSHDAVLLLFTQPEPESQVSVVQTLPSSQSGAAPPMHDPPEQTSFVVQALPSSQEAVLLTLTQLPEPTS